MIFSPMNSLSLSIFQLSYVRLSCKPHTQYYAHILVPLPALLFTFYRSWTHSGIKICFFFLFLNVCFYICVLTFVSFFVLKTNKYLQLEWTKCLELLVLLKAALNYTLFYSAILSQQRHKFIVSFRMIRTWKRAQSCWAVISFILTMS